MTTDPLLVPTAIAVASPPVARGTVAFPPTAKAVALTLFGLLAKTIALADPPSPPPVCEPLPPKPARAIADTVSELAVLEFKTCNVEDASPPDPAIPESARPPLPPREVWLNESDPPLEFPLIASTRFSSPPFPEVAPEVPALQHHLGQLKSLLHYLHPS